MIVNTRRVVLKSAVPALPPRSGFIRVTLLCRVGGVNTLTYV